MTFEICGLWCVVRGLSSVVRGLSSPMPLILYLKPPLTKFKKQRVFGEFNQLRIWYAGIIEDAIIGERPISFSRAESINVNLEFTNSSGAR